MRRGTMTKAKYKRQALEAIDKAARLLMSAAHDYELAGCDHESDLTYGKASEVRAWHARLKPRRRKKASPS